MSHFHKYILLNCLVLLGFSGNAGAAGTYYTGAAYQPAQYRYGQSASYTTSGTQNYASSVGYNNYTTSNTYGQTYAAQPYRNTNSVQNQTQSSQKQSGSAKKGFFVNGGITHESAMWKIEMVNTANSILSYNNVAWNVLDLNGGYVFDLGKTKMQVDAGFKYGMQWGESTMNDDDITNGGYLVEEWQDGGSGAIVTQVGHALSTGASKDGNLLGFNIGFGLTDFWRWGNVKITPSIGYRYFKYKLETKNNFGLMIDTLNGANSCFSFGNGEIQCDPVLIFYNTAFGDTPGIVDRSDTNGDGVIDSNDRIQVPAGYSYVYAGNSYYYEQSGVTHSYETEWSGPYIAFDMLYDINQNNSVNGRVELGFPGYKSTGDQPYRPDWQHPKSVEDSASMFSAFHLGLAANWKTAITNNIALSLGLTYDYYTVSGADANTYLNPQYYTALYNSRLQEWQNAGHTEQEMLNPTTGDATALKIVQLESDCHGWVCKSSKEIDSIYKSMGIRIGIDAKF
ncbi:MAG: hypothetical protein J5679_01965 [Alphaproteobacteria bacterium]|nr:hypothetical protein [Alphaproteobacteria bacterium]